jgi:HSP20 family protein
MSESQELAVREKQQLAKKEERTMPGRYFIPPADVFETDDALTVILEMPGVEKNDLSIALEHDTLRVEGKIDFSKYPGDGASLYRVYRRALRAWVHVIRKD